MPLEVIAESFGVEVAEVEQILGQVKSQDSGLSRRMWCLGR